MKRDFTYIDDIISGIISAIDKNYKCEVFNLGNNRSEKLLNMIQIIETCLNKKAKIDYKPMQPGDVKESHAAIEKSQEMLEYNPKTNIEEGIKNFIDWFIYYND